MTTQVHAGKLRHRLEVQTFDTFLDENGQPARNYSTKFKIWGNVLPMSGTELETAMRIDSRIKHKIEARYDPRITAQARIFYNDKNRGERIFNVISLIDVDERNHKMELGCEEIKNG